MPVFKDQENTLVIIACEFTTDMGSGFLWLSYFSDCLDLIFNPNPHILYCSNHAFYTYVLDVLFLFHPYMYFAGSSDPTHVSIYMYIYSCSSLLGYWLYIYIYMYAFDVLHYYGPDSMIIYIYIYICLPMLFVILLLVMHIHICICLPMPFIIMFLALCICVYIYIYMRMFYYGDPPRLVLELLSVHCHDYSCVSFAHVNLFAWEDL